jgi:anti-sigma factor RsiW
MTIAAGMLVEEWRISGVSGKAARLVFVALLCGGWTNLAPAQQVLVPVTVPPNFTADAVFAAWVRSQLVPYTTSPSPVRGRQASHGDAAAHQGRASEKALA